MLDVLGPEVIASPEDPDQLAKNDVRDKRSFLILEGIEEDRTSPGRLLGIVLDKEAHKNVGVEGDQSPAAPRRIASSMSSRVSPFFRGFRRP